MQSTVEAFIAKWQGVEGGQERANYALFLTELCDVLGECFALPHLAKTAVRTSSMLSASVSALQLSRRNRPFRKSIPKWTETKLWTILDRQYLMNNEIFQRWVEAEECKKI